MILWKPFPSLVKKDVRLLIAGKFPIVVLGSLLLYTMFINLGYISFMNAGPYQVYLYDPAGTQAGYSERILRVHSSEELEQALSADENGVGIDASSGDLLVVFYAGSEKADNHRRDYALSLLQPASAHAAATVGSNTPEMRQRREITCELLFIELIAVGFLGVASVLFKEKHMGVIRIHAILPLEKRLLILSKITVFLLFDLVFAALLTLLNVEISGAFAILPAALAQTALLSLIMALIGFACALLLRDFKQFSLAYLVIAVFAAAPVFLMANTSVKMAWVRYHPFYHLYMGLKNAYFGTSHINAVYCIGAVLAVGMLYFLVQGALYREMGKEG